MGRSKFPGKPSKHVNKKRVNVLPCSVTKSNGTSTVYNVLSETSSANNTCLATDQVYFLLQFSILTYNCSYIHKFIASLLSL